MPEGIQRLMQRVVGTYRAERLLVAGEMVLPIAPSRSAWSMNWSMSTRSSRDRGSGWPPCWRCRSRSMRQTRAIARADLVAALQPEQIQLPRFIDAWYDPATQAALQALVARLGK